VGPSSPERAFQDALRAAAEACGLSLGEIPVGYPPDVAQGDLASAVCFDLARTERKAPRALADAIVAAFVPSHGIVRLQAAGGGYLNGFLDRPACLSAWLTADRTPREPSGGKVIVEHTNINPNKAAHIGHLRNAVLGDTLVRCLKQLGRSVETQNYIDDTGVQVADLVVGFLVLRGEDLPAVRAHYCAGRPRRAIRFLGVGPLRRGHALLRRR
jgi:arginyl-tRNA synthetase